MGYALFSQRKVSLTSNVNTVGLQQTQRSNEQYNLATQTLSLQQQLTSLSAAQSNELADYYEILSYATEDGGLDSDFLDNYNVSKGEITETDSSGTNSTRKVVKGVRDLISRRGATSITRDNINSAIKQVEKEYQVEQDKINREIYEVSSKEQAVELEIKRLDTMLTSLKQELDQVLDAESDAIEKATPQFNGVG